MAELAADGPKMQSEWIALSSLDGRDADMVDSLRPHMSEYGYMHNRTRVEAAWMMELSDKLPEAKLPDQAIDYLSRLADGASVAELIFSRFCCINNP